GADMVSVYWGRVTGLGGTSYSAPIIASTVALLNDELIAAGKSTLGFLNPLIYANPDAFSDVARGDNPGCGTNGFSAVEGWDPLSGVGTPIYSALRKAAAQRVSQSLAKCYYAAGSDKTLLDLKRAWIQEGVTARDSDTPRWRAPVDLLARNSIPAAPCSHTSFVTCMLLAMRILPTSIPRPSTVATGSLALANISKATFLIHYATLYAIPVFSLAMLCHASLHSPMHIAINVDRRSTAVKASDSWKWLQWAASEVYEWPAALRPHASACHAEFSDSGD
ncbi:hypothetical protein EVG20_g11443, partial [Dentipellis fragilis]